MDKSKDLSAEHRQQTTPLRLQKACHILQRFEQKMILIGYRSDQIALKMQKIRENIKN
ncbi:hypothetical protein [Endozoicomonas sp. SCSIO W0465]|uniref:hypothetical protein n=1 Tax=Endozoicomonas sp. SCSIO W0465 TaxID=2918516 RepID=UPI0020763E2D|nr:hypothetical protein [Endozoicomonas sp. SCSIO W0465]USE35158.1 hypothetical protein MJO57_24105 [Endozoicomonas sp. SCSIO W0465]